APLHALFASADAVVANYETATGSVDAARERALVYSVDPAWMDAVAGSGVTALTLANNHACDLGTAGLTATIDAARGNVVGLGADREDPWKARTVAEKNGRRVCVVAWTTFVNDAGSACERSDALALAPLGKRGTERAAQAIRNARASGCDVTIAIAHGGLEYEPQARPMRAQALAIAEAGADAVVLHHPHVPSPIVVAETSDGRRVPIFESIGNLVSNQGESWTTAYPPMQADHRIVYLNGWTRAGIVAEVDIDVDGPKPALTFGYHVVWTDNDHLADKSNKTPRIATRVLDPVADAAITHQLGRDRKLGPLLASPCWMESSRSICR
ncbi:MAG: CapA family protein, partial [Polyangiaceae bacterium]